MKLFTPVNPVTQEADKQFPLNEGQAAARDAILSGSNVCISGSGGCGKSWLLNHMKLLQADSAIFVAPTGKAAINIGGSTCHSVFGIPIGYPTEKGLAKVSPKTKKLFSGNVIKTVYIDEIFMNRVDSFWAIDQKLRKLKNNNLPFGGLQVVVMGDVFQLEPVLQPKTKEHTLVMDHFGGKYPFHCDVWDELNFDYIILHKVERTSDPVFKENLERIRFGHELDIAIPWFNQNCYTTRPPTNTLKIVTTNAKVEAENAKHYSLNRSEEHIYPAVVKGTFKKTEEPAPKTLALKVGLNVLLTANDVNGQYNNGSTGVITYLSVTEIVVKLASTGEEVLIEPFKWEKRDYVTTAVAATDDTPARNRVDQVVVGSWTQFPVLQADALTVHRVQGSTIRDGAVIDLGWKCFAAGQAYVALSRLTNVENLHLVRKIRREDIVIDEDVMEFYNMMKEKALNA